MCVYVLCAKPLSSGAKVASYSRSSQSIKNLLKSVYVWMCVRACVCMCVRMCACMFELVLLIVDVVQTRRRCVAAAAVCMQCQLAARPKSSRYFGCACAYTHTHTRTHHHAHTTHMNLPFIARYTKAPAIRSKPQRVAVLQTRYIQLYKSVKKEAKVSMPYAKYYIHSVEHTAPKNLQSHRMSHSHM